MTPYSAIFDSFKNLIIRDAAFLKDKPVDMLETRMVNLLRHGISKMVGVRDNKNLPINFYKVKDDATKTFAVDLNDFEIDLLAYFMYQCYLEEMSIVRINALRANGFSDKEIKSFSTAELLDRYLKALNDVTGKNLDMLKQYRRMDRDTFEYKRFDYIFN